MALNFCDSSDFLDLSVGIQILTDVEKFLPRFGLASGLFVGHAPELRIEFTMKIVAYALFEKASMNLEYSKTC